MSWVFQVIEVWHFQQDMLTLNFPTVGENICMSRTATSQPLTRRTRRGRGRCV